MYRRRLTVSAIFLQQKWAWTYLPAIRLGNIGSVRQIGTLRKTTKWYWTGLRRNKQLPRWKNWVSKKAGIRFLPITCWICGTITCLPACGLAVIRITKGLY